MDNLGYEYATLYGFGIKDEQGKVKREIINRLDCDDKLSYNKECAESIEERLTNLMSPTDVMYKFTRNYICDSRYKQQSDDEIFQHLEDLYNAKKITQIEQDFICYATFVVNYGMVVSDKYFYYET